MSKQLSIKDFVRSRQKESQIEENNNLSLQEFSERTNIKELMKKDIKKRFPEKYEMKINNFDHYVEKMYKKFLMPEYKNRGLFKKLKFKSGKVDIVKNCSKESPNSRIRLTASSSGIARSITPCNVVKPSTSSEPLKNVSRSLSFEDKNTSNKNVNEILKSKPCPLSKKRLNASDPKKSCPLPKKVKFCEVTSEKNENSSDQDVANENHSLAGKKENYNKGENCATKGKGILKEINDKSESSSTVKKTENEEINGIAGPSPLTQKRATLPRRQKPCPLSKKRKYQDSNPEKDSVLRTSDDQKSIGHKTHPDKSEENPSISIIPNFENESVSSIISTENSIITVVEIRNQNPPEKKQSNKCDKSTGTTQKEMNTSVECNTGKKTDKPFCVEWNVMDVFTKTNFIDFVRNFLRSYPGTVKGKREDCLIQNIMEDGAKIIAEELCKGKQINLNGFTIKEPIKKEIADVLTLQEAIDKNITNESASIYEKYEFSANEWEVPKRKIYPKFVKLSVLEAYTNIAHIIRNDNIKKHAHNPKIIPKYFAYIFNNISLYYNQVFIHLDETPEWLLLRKETTEDFYLMYDYEMKKQISENLKEQESLSCVVVSQENELKSSPNDNSPQNDAKSIHETNMFSQMIDELFSSEPERVEENQMCTNGTIIQEGPLILDKIHPKSLSYEDFLKYTNIEEYACKLLKVKSIKSDILKEHIAKYYHNEFKKLDSFPPGLVYNKPEPKKIRFNINLGEESNLEINENTNVLGNGPSTSQSILSNFIACNEIKTQANSQDNRAQKHDPLECVIVKEEDPFTSTYQPATLNDDLGKTSPNKFKVKMEHAKLKNSQKCKTIVIHDEAGLTSSQILNLMNESSRHYETEDEDDDDLICISPKDCSIIDLCDSTTVGIDSNLNETNVREFIKKEEKYNSPKIKRPRIILPKSPIMRNDPNITSEYILPDDSQILVRKQNPANLLNFKESNKNKLPIASKEDPISLGRPNKKATVKLINNGKENFNRKVKKARKHVDAFGEFVPQAKHTFRSLSIAQKNDIQNMRKSINKAVRNLSKPKMNSTKEHKYPGKRNELEDYIEDPSQCEVINFSLENENSLPQSAPSSSAKNSNFLEMNPVQQRIEVVNSNLNSYGNGNHPEKQHSPERIFKNQKDFFSTNLLQNLTCLSIGQVESSLSAATPFKSNTPKQLFYSSRIPLEFNLHEALPKYRIKISVNYRCNYLNTLHFIDDTIRILLGLTEKSWICLLNLLAFVKEFSYNFNKTSGKDFSSIISREFNKVNEKSIIHELLCLFFKSVPKFSQVTFEFEENHNIAWCVKEEKESSKSRLNNEENLMKILGSDTLEAMERFTDSC